MELEDDNLDGDFLCDLLTADNDAGCSASFLGEEARLEQDRLLYRSKVKSKGKVEPVESVLLEIPENVSSTCVSSIHTGDTDSSDDDDNRNQLDTNLNSYGKSVKSMLPKENQALHTFYSEKTLSWKAKSKSVCRNSAFSGPSLARSACDDSVDPVFNIRISERLISSTSLQERMKGRLAVSMDGLKQFTETGDKETDWVLAGAIIFKSPMKTSVKGTQYSTWRLSDLKPGLKTVTVFLFGSASKDLWKTSVGTVIGILNPSIIDNRDGSGDEAALSVDLAQRVMILGKSKDYGLCKSMKKNGERCTMFVNKRDCDVCIYHVQSEYRKCSRRSELQSTASRTPTLRNKVLGKSEVFYGGKSFTSIPTCRNRNHVAKDKGTIQRLNGHYSAPAVIKPSCSRVTGGANSKINVQFDLHQEDCKDGIKSKTDHTCIKEKTQYSVSTLESVHIKADKFDSKTLLVGVKNKTGRVEAAPEKCTFLLEESAGDDGELCKQKIPKITFDTTKNTQRVALDVVNKVTDGGTNQKVNLKNKTRKLEVKPEKYTLHLEESAGDDGELCKHKIPKIAVDRTTNSQRVAWDVVNKVIDRETNTKVNVSKEIEATPENTSKLIKKKKKSDHKASDIKLQRTSTSISNKVTKPDVEPLYLGLASRLGLGLNNKAVSKQAAKSSPVKLLAHKLATPSIQAMSRGELNLKLLKLSVVVPKPKTNSCKPEVASNLNELKEKRKAEFEKKRRLERDSSRSAELNVLKPDSSSKQSASILSSSSLMAPKVSTLPTPKVDFSLLQSCSKKNLEAKVGNLMDTMSQIVPCLMSGNGIIDLNEPIPRNRRDSAKMNAMRFAKNHGGFKKLDPNATTHADPVASKRKRELSCDPSEEQPRAEDKAMQDKFKELIETKSRHSGLLEVHYDKEKEDYFNKLEKKEQLEEKMLSTFEVKCKAVTCLECKYTSFSASEICKADGHALKTRDAMKRFFKCADCGNRTVVLTRIPNTSCSKCRSSHWQRAAMIKERKTDDVVLSIRGAEEKYFGSHSGGNINLLVPMC